MKENTNHLP